jgi:hypothetical protein
VLNTIFNVFKDATDSAKKSDMRRLSLVDNHTKSRIEKSKTYIGYKLLWTIKLSLDGKTFPFGNLNEAKWRVHVYDISNFIYTRDFLIPLMEFDPECLFSIILGIFRLRPLHYIQTHDYYKDFTGSTFNLC